MPKKDETKLKKGEMTIREAGRLGGTKTSQTHDKAHFQKIGKMGGETTKKKMGPDFYHKMSEKGRKRMRQLIDRARKAGF